MRPPRAPWALLAALLLGAATRAAASGGYCTCDAGITDCSHRHKSQIRVAELCPNTSTIDMQGNNMVVFPDGLRDFAVVLASENRLARLPAASQLGAHTRVLDLSRNAISNSSRELGALSRLKLLRVYSNFLTSLEFLPRPCELVVLDASDNSLFGLEGLQECKQLAILYLAKNQLASLPAGLFSNMKKIKDLFLDSNMIETVSEGAFRGMQNLRKLTLARNLLTSLPEGLLRDNSRLQWLDLSGNGLSVLPTTLLDGATQLKALYLHNNQLLALPARLFQGVRALRVLQGWKNRLTELPDLSECCPHLEVANFDNNNLTARSQEIQRVLLERLQGRPRK